MTTAVARPTLDGVPIPAPGVFDLDPAHTTVGFVARHLMVSQVRGSFALAGGTITVAADPLASTVQASIDAASITTGNPDRDNHLRSADFLDVERFPTLEFHGRRVSAHSGNQFTLVGDLTIRDLTREVELAVVLDGVGSDLSGRDVVGVTATTELDREEFGITWNVALEAGGVLVGRKVRVEITAEAVRRG